MKASIEAWPLESACSTTRRWSMMKMAAGP
jgi:hypothetical protein